MSDKVKLLVYCRSRREVFNRSTSIHGRICENGEYGISPMSDQVAVGMLKVLGALDDAYNKLFYLFIGFIFCVF